MDLWLIILLIVVAVVIVAAVAVQRGKRGRLLMTQTGRREEGKRP